MYYEFMYHYSTMNSSTTGTVELNREWWASHLESTGQLLTGANVSASQKNPYTYVYGVGPTSTVLKSCTADYD